MAGRTRGSICRSESGETFDRIPTKPSISSRRCTRKLLQELLLLLLESAELRLLLSELPLLIVDLQLLLPDEGIDCT